MMYWIGWILKSETAQHPIEKRRKWWKVLILKLVITITIAHWELASEHYELELQIHYLVFVSRRPSDCFLENLETRLDWSGQSYSIFSCKHYPMAFLWKEEEMSNLGFLQLRQANQTSLVTAVVSLANTFCAQSCQILKADWWSFWGDWRNKKPLSLESVLYGLGWSPQHATQHKRLKMSVNSFFSVSAPLQLRLPVPSQKVLIEP